MATRRLCSGGWLADDEQSRVCVSSSSSSPSHPIRVVGYGDFACVLCRPRRTGTNLSRNKRNILQPFVAVGGCKLFVILFCGLQSLGLLSAQWVRLWLLLLLLVGFGGKDGGGGGGQRSEETIVEGRRGQSTFY